MNADYFDSLETRSTAERDAAMARAVPALLRAAQAVPAWRERLEGVDPDAVTTRAALARLPVTRKAELLAAQQARRGSDAFAGFSALGWRQQPALRPAQRVFQSPGPLYEPEGPGADYWRSARALYAAGFRAGDLVHNSFSYHLTPGAWIMEGGARALGCSVFPGGVGNTELQLQAMEHLRPHGYVGTPSFLRILLEKADETGLKLPSLRKALLSGEACPPSLRDWLAARGVAAFQAYATAEAGVIAYETPARDGLVVDEGVLLEIVRPGTGDVLPVGEVGEVVVTVFNADYPMVRLATGDLSALLPGPCPTGRTQLRIKGWMGRADQTAKVRGMFVHPSQVAEVLKRHPELTRARLVVQGEMANDRLTLRAECADVPEGLQAAVAGSVRDLTKLRCEVEFVAPGVLPNDGKVIDDERSYR